MLRPKNPVSAGNAADNNSSFVSSSTGGSSALGRPSLLTDIRQDLDKKRQTPWNVSDSALRPISLFYPPLNPRCSTLITDSPPSVVALRISECLRKRSISVEFDEEMNSATCLTVDRVHFNIYLYRGQRVSVVDPENVATVPDLEKAVIVEVVLSRGPVMSFHHHNRAILNAAKGLDTGEDKRKWYQTSSLEYRRLESLYSRQERPAKRVAGLAIVPQALEHVLSCLRKDRIDAQRLGMETLVSLTDCGSSGKDLAVHASLAMLGAPVIDGEASLACDELQQFLLRFVQDRLLPGEKKEDPVETSFESSVFDDNNESGLGDSSSRQSQESPAIIVLDDAHHGGVLRSMALRVLTNALTILSEHQTTLLASLLESSQWISRQLVQALAEDVVGGSRLPAVVAGTRLASAHEATLATKCLGTLATLAPSVRRLLVKNSDSAILDLLNRNQQVRHDFLVQESKKAYYVLSHEFRSC